MGARTADVTRLELAKRHLRAVLERLPRQGTDPAAFEGIRAELEQSAAARASATRLLLS